MRKSKIVLRKRKGLRSLSLIFFLFFILTFPHQNLILFDSAQTGVAYVPITIANSQANPTLAPFQLSISVNPSLYAQYENSQLGNIRFYSSFSGSAFGGALNAWMESFSGSATASLATSATIWISIPNGIAANSNLVIYMVFEGLATQFDGASWGEAPSLSSTYGQYDNGAEVFSVYNNGGSLFSLSQTGTGGSGPLVTSMGPSPNSHAITGSVIGGGGAVNTWTSNGETTTALPSSYIAQALVYLSGSAALTDLLTNVESISTGQFYSFRFDARGGSFDLIGNYPTGATSTNILAQSSITSTVGTWYQMTALDDSDMLSLFKSTSANLGNYGALEAGPVKGLSYSGGGIALTTDGATSTEFWTMVIVRAYPPNGIMPSSSDGSIMAVAPSSPYSDSYQQSNSSIRAPSVVLGTTSSPSYVPILITNSQNAPTKLGLQVSLAVDFQKYKSYLVSDAGNIRFFNASTFTSSYELPAWLETYSGNSTDAAYTATSSEIWLNLKGTVISALSSITIYMVFESSLDFDGVYWGEAPYLSTTYGQFDNGANVFVYYNVAPSGTTGWALSGTAGQTSSAPPGSYFESSKALYANSANGDYLDSQIQGLSTNEVITFWVYTTGLGNVFFLDNSAGSGQMARLDSRGGGNWAGLATTTSWTNWNAPSSGLDETAGKWYKYDLVINSTGATAYIGASSSNISTLGTRANSLAISNNGAYLGLVGDGLGSTYVTYWNGFLVRYYSPNGIAPAASLGNIVTSAISETVMPQLNEASIGLSSGLEFYENATAPTSCSSPATDTSLSQPAGSSSFSLGSGSSACLWSQQFSNASILSAGTWNLQLWASASSAGTIQASIYTTNSTGAVVSTIISGAPTGSIQTVKSLVVSKFSGSGGSLQANGRVKIVLSALSGGPSLFTIYWGNSQATNFKTPELFNNVLLINNTSSSQWFVNLGVASTSNQARLSNFTAWFSSAPGSQIELGSSIATPELQGTQVLLASHAVTYLCLDALATTVGTSTVLISLKLQSFQGGPYSQYTIILQLN